MVQEADLKEGQPRLLTVDREVVVPVNKNVQVGVKANDVIHDWAVPSFGIKLDAVPGRLQSTWFRAERTGVFHGQCSELCGRNHAFMPITVRVVTDEEFAAWLAEDEGRRQRHRRYEQAGSCRQTELKSPLPPRAATTRKKTRELECKEDSDGIQRPGPSRSPPRRPSDRLAPLGLFHQPQRHRHDVPDLRDRGRYRSVACSPLPCAWNS